MLSKHARRGLMMGISKAVLEGFPSVLGPCKFNTQLETKCSTWSKCRYIAENGVVFFWGRC